MGIGLHLRGDFGEVQIQCALAAVMRTFPYALRQWHGRGEKRRSV